MLNKDCKTMETIFDTVVSEVEFLLNNTNLFFNEM